MLKKQKNKNSKRNIASIAGNANAAVHDKNGNMTVMPGLKAKYDAWNRLTEVRDASDNLIAQYEYNGLNQRIKKTVNSVVTKSFFNENWQELESVSNNQTTTYVWGLRCIDDLVLRERGEERLYSLADPNWNVIAVCSANGTVVERMKYDAFGSVSWLDVAYGAKAASNYAWNRTFTGQVLDMETMLMLYRNRYYHTGLGRFINRDPIEYEGDDENLYRYVYNSPCLNSDLYGTSIKVFGIDVSIEASASITKTFPLPPYPPIIPPGSTLTCSVAGQVKLAASCCKNCKEYNYNQATFSVSCFARIGWSTMTTPVNRVDDRGKLIPIRNDTPPPITHTSDGSGFGIGLSFSGTDCPNVGYNGELYGFVNAQTGAGFIGISGYVKKKIASVQQMSGIFSDWSTGYSYVYGVYGAFVDIGAEGVMNYVWDLGPSGNDCTGTPIPPPGGYPPPVITSQ